MRTRNRHPEGRKRARAVFSGRVALRDLVVGKCLIRFHHQRKVPHPYSGADDSAPSLTGFGMTPFWMCQALLTHALKPKTKNARYAALPPASAWLTMRQVERPN